MPPSSTPLDPSPNDASTGPTPARPFPAALVVFILLWPAFFVLFRHEWWRDEAYTWLVARASHSPADLVTQLGFNGHPRFYYLLAYSLTQLSPSPVLLALSNLALALGAIYFLLRSAPLPTFAKVLFAVGFFPLYQYGIIVRCYSLLLFLLFWYAYLKVRHPGRLVWRFLILAVLAQVHLMALGISASLVAFELGESLWNRRPWSRAAWVAAIVVVASMLLSVWQLIPPPAWSKGSSLLRFVTALPYGFANGFFPNYGYFHRDPPNKIQEIVGFGLWGLSWVVLLRHRRALWCYAALTAPLVVIHALVYAGHRWHHGLYFLFFIVAVWVGIEAPLRDRWMQRFLVSLLGLHAAIGLYALTEDVVRPYSNGEAVAATIHSKHLDDLPLVGIAVSRLPNQQVALAWEIDQIQPVLLSLPGKRAYDPLSKTFEPIWRHYSEPSPFLPISGDAVVQELSALAQRSHQDVIVVAVLPDMGPFPELPAPLHKIAEFPKPLDYGEHLELYEFPVPAK